MSSLKETRDTLSPEQRPNVIDRFNEQHKFLSNFQASTIFYEGKKYPSVEHAYQAQKTIDLKEQEMIRLAVSPSQAKKLGKQVMLQDGWDDIKTQLMLELLRLKFQNPFLRHKLLATGNAVLIEGNVWHDTFFGVCKCTKCGNTGLNVLGKLLMQVREEIRLEEAGVTQNQI